MTNDTVMPVMPAGMSSGFGNSNGWNDGAWWDEASTERERDAIRRCMDMM